jgi:hypothetical protein
MLLYFLQWKTCSFRFCGTDLGIEKEHNLLKGNEVLSTAIYKTSNTGKVYTVINKCIFKLKTPFSYLKV